MARSPSARALSNRVSLYRYTPVQDEDGGVSAGPYGAAFATDVACSVQPADPERFLDATTDRLIQKNMYNVYFASNYGLVTDDKITWVDSASITHALYVHGSADQSGKGGTFKVTTEERR